ncbi:MAG: hypothetical protein Q9171_005546 [Xanthocarpia ochracea]
MGSGKASGERTFLASKKQQTSSQSTPERAHAELERKLRELQQEGIQATIEVQQSARKVVQEKKRLKELIRHVGVGEETINQWVSGEKREGGDDHDDEPDCQRKRGCSRRVAGGTGVQADLSIGHAQGEGYQGWEVVTETAPLLEYEQVHLSHPAQTNPRDSNSSIGDGLLPFANETPTPARDKSLVNNIPP